MCFQCYDAVVVGMSLTSTEIIMLGFILVAYPIEDKPVGRKVSKTIEGYWVSRCMYTART
jgi:hypothetical protein